MITQYNYAGNEYVEMEALRRRDDIKSDFPSTTNVTLKGDVRTELSGSIYMIGDSIITIVKDERVELNRLEIPISSTRQTRLSVNIESETQQQTDESRKHLENLLGISLTMVEGIKPAERA